MGHIVAIPLGRPFVDDLARGLLDLGRDRCAAATVLLPGRRACVALREAFLRVSSGAAMLLPRLVPVGDLEPADLRLDGGVELGLPPAMPPLRRRLLLARLVRARGETTVEQAVRLAVELERLLDEIETEEVALVGLETLVDDELAGHWQATLGFLRILERLWPAVEAEEGTIGPAARRRAALDAVARLWARHPPDGDVIAAGLTGTVPAVARLVGLVAGLPRGLVVLPGFDTGLDAASWAAIEPSHPQAGLRALLDRIGIDRGAVVTPWPPDRATATPGPRLRLLSDVLRPAATTAAWRSLPPPPDEALAGLTLVEAPDPAAEAVEIALRLRAALETPGRTAALVTSDRNLSRRVAAELRRWGIEADDSAGVPLDQTPPGSFLLLLAHALIDAGGPVALLSLLKHPLAQGGRPPGELRRYTRALERAALRGPRPAGGLDGLLQRLADPRLDEHWPAPVPRLELLAWLAALRADAAPLADLPPAGPQPLQALLDAHLLVAERIAANAEGDAAELWSKAAGEAARDFLAELRPAAAGLEPIPPSAYAAVLAVLMGGVSVRPRQPRHPRIAILGQIESRLVQADLVILGGLVEGVWPRLPETGPWLNRRMRQRLGLPPLELRIGIAAHDFASAAAGPEVVLSRALKDVGGAATKPSRWLARLTAVLRSLGRAERVRPPPGWTAWRLALDAPSGAPRPCPRPAPRPPVAARPRRLSVTEIDRLMRDPYAVYARRILDLAPLEPLDQDPGAAERGQLIHKAVELFVQRWQEQLPDDPEAELLRIGREVFAAHAHLPEVMSLWWPRFAGVAAWFAAQELARRGEVARVLAEVRGQLRVAAPGGEITIRSRADRIELGRDGALTLIDYKTGRLPSASEMRLGLRPQIALEAAIALQGGFSGLSATELGALALWQLAGGEAGGEVCDPTLERGSLVTTPAELARQAVDGVTRLLDHFDDPQTAYLPVPRPEIAPDHGDFDHLSRLAEWRGAEDVA